MKKSITLMLAVILIGAAPFILIGAAEKAGAEEAEGKKFAEISMEDIEEISKVQYVVKSYPEMIPAGYEPTFATPEDLVLTEAQKDQIKKMNLKAAFIWFGKDVAYKIGKQAVSRTFDPLGIHWTEHVASTADEQIRYLEALEAKAKAGKLDFFHNRSLNH